MPAKINSNSRSPSSMACLSAAGVLPVTRHEHLASLVVGRAETVISWLVATTS